MEEVPKEVDSHRSSQSSRKPSTSPAPPSSSLNPSPSIPHNVTSNQHGDLVPADAAYTQSSPAIPSTSLLEPATTEAIDIIANLREISKITDMPKDAQESNDAEAEEEEAAPSEPLVLPPHWQLYVTRVPWDKPLKPSKDEPSSKNDKKKKKKVEEKVVYVAQKRYLLVDKLGKGGFGYIYAGVDLETSEEVAIKLEDTTKKKKNYLKLEFEIYRRLHSQWLHVPFYLEQNVPRVHFFGEEDEFRVLVLDLLGPSLNDLFNHCNERFTLKTTCMLAVKVITCIEHVHAIGLLHRDIKPGNFVMGRGKKANALYLIDFGLASPYIDEKGDHVPFVAGVRFHGTDKYASVNNHKKLQPNRRDDLESIGYLLVLFMNGDLPWSQRYGDVKRKHRRIAYGNMKELTPPEELTKGLPYNFLRYFRYLQSLHFSDKPDYNYMRSLFLDILDENEEPFDEDFDWTPLPNEL